MSSKTNSMMSENLKIEIAKELGVYDLVKKDGGWGNVSSKTCGNMVSKAIEIANRNLEKQVLSVLYLLDKIRDSSFFGYLLQKRTVP